MVEEQEKLGVNVLSPRNINGDELLAQSTKVPGQDAIGRRAAAVKRLEERRLNKERLGKENTGINGI